MLRGLLQAEICLDSLFWRYVSNPNCVQLAFKLNGQNNRGDFQITELSHAFGKGCQASLTCVVLCKHGPVVEDLNLTFHQSIEQVQNHTVGIKSQGLLSVLSWRYDI